MARVLQAKAKRGIELGPAIVEEPGRFRQGTDGIESREVTVGENNEKFVEVKSGLTEGEAVCLDARARAATESQTGENGGKQNGGKQAVKSTTKEP